MKGEQVRNIRNRLHRVAGHLISVDKMLEQHPLPDEALNQFLAIDKATRNLIYEQVDKLVRHSIHQRIERLLGVNAALSKELDYMREKAPTLPLNKLPKLLYRLRQLEAENGLLFSPLC
ncbi:MAG: metal-sensing transcriptional repressor [Bacteroidia bacterium]